MDTYNGGGMTIGKIFTWMLIGVLAIITLKVGLALAGLVIGLGFFALFTIGPILLVGWLVIKAIRYFTRDSDSVTV